MFFGMFGMSIAAAVKFVYRPILKMSVQASADVVETERNALATSLKFGTLSVTVFQNSSIIFNVASASARLGNVTSACIRMRFIHH